MITHRHCLETNFQTPRFRDQSVLFFANLKSLFLGNTEQMNELIDLVGELDSYGGRLIPILNLLYRSGKNTLVLERMPETSLMQYFVEKLDLELPKIHLMNPQLYESLALESVDTLKELIAEDFTYVDGYVTDEKLNRWAGLLGCEHSCSIEGYRIGNNKTCLHQHLVEVGLPTPDTVVEDCSDRISEALLTLQKKGYQRAVIRAAIGASGIGMIGVDIQAEQSVQVPAMFFHGGPCLVQGWFEKDVLGVESVTSPSVQFFIQDDGIDLFDITSQILSGDSVHEGNYAPPGDYGDPTLTSIMEQAIEVSRWLHENGYRGPGSVDFIVVEMQQGGEMKPYVCEVNARVTGATYPSVLARHLRPDGAWLMRNIRFETRVKGADVLDMLEKGDWLYEKGKSSGVIPINLNSHKDGRVAKGQFLYLNNKIEACSKQLDHMVESLPVRTSIERD